MPKRPAGCYEACSHTAQMLRNLHPCAPRQGSLPACLALKTLPRPPSPAPLPPANDRDLSFQVAGFLGHKLNQTFSLFTLACSDLPQFPSRETARTWGSGNSTENVDSLLE